jgi:Tfp pilus assembly protein PilO
MKIMVAILVIIALGVVGFFIKGYFDQSAVSATYSTKVESDNKSLKAVTASNKSLTVEIADLKAKQAQVQQTLDTESKAVPARMNINDIVDALMTAGRQYSVTVIPLTTTDWAATKIAQGEYWVFKAKMEVNGTQDNLVTFLKYVQDSICPTLIIETVDISQITPTPTATAIPTSTVTPIPTTPPANGGIVKANLAVSVYAK